MPNFHGLKQLNVHVTSTVLHVHIKYMYFMVTFFLVVWNVFSATIFCFRKPVWITQAPYSRPTCVATLLFGFATVACGDHPPTINFSGILMCSFWCEQEGFRSGQAAWYVMYATVAVLFRSDILMKRQNHFSWQSLSFFLLLPTGVGLQIAASPYES